MGDSASFPGESNQVGPLFAADELFVPVTNSGKLEKN